MVARVRHVLLELPAALVGVLASYAERRVAAERGLEGLRAAGAFWTVDGDRMGLSLAGVHATTSRGAVALLERWLEAATGECQARRAPPAARKRPRGRDGRKLNVQPPNPVTGDAFAVLAAGVRMNQPVSTRWLHNQPETEHVAAQRAGEAVRKLKALGYIRPLPAGIGQRASRWIVTSLGQAAYYAAVRAMTPPQPAAVSPATALATPVAVRPLPSDRISTDDRPAAIHALIGPAATRPAAAGYTVTAYLAVRRRPECAHA